MAGSVRRDGDGAASDVDAVLKIRIRRQPRRKPNNDVELAHETLLHFSYVPETDLSVTTTYTKQIGVDVLPKLLDGQDYRINGTCSGSTAQYPKMPLRVAESCTTLTAREHIWLPVKDVREPAAPVTNTEMIVTAGMLRELPDDPMNPGTANLLDAKSEWTVFEGLMVFGAISADFRDDNLLTNESPYSGLEPELTADKSELLNPKGKRGKYSLDGSVVIDNDAFVVCVTDLNIEIEYLGGMDIDIDYVVIQTPNGRAIVRDMHRKTFETAFKEVGAKFANNTDDGATKKLLGIRSIEEHGEEHWYTQRYLNLLFKGVFGHVSG